MAKESKGTRRQFGKYRLIAQLATGGMAEIFLAHQTSLAGFEKLVVIKRILPHLAGEERFVEMFLDEARIAASLNHPNIVQIFDLGRIGQQYFIAMEYLAGESLSMVITMSQAQINILAPVLAAGIVMQAAEGLHYAHTQVGKDGNPLNIVHRDISPQNVFVLYDGRAKVVDFGIAKAASSSSKTKTGTLKGKFAYMSPEQIIGLPLDGRADVFSLGIVLWESLTGQKLYPEENDLRLLETIVHRDAPSPLEINPDVPKQLANITQRALERERDNRYQTAAEMRGELYKFLKKTHKEADTMAIGRYMRDLFTERIEQKQRLIKGAQDADTSSQEYLLGDLPHLPESKPSLPQAPLDISTIPHTRTLPRPEIKRLPKRAILISTIAVAVTLIMLIWLIPSSDSNNNSEVETTNGKVKDSGSNNLSISKKSHNEKVNNHDLELVSLVEKKNSNLEKRDSKASSQDPEKEKSSTSSEQKIRMKPLRIQKIASNGKHQLRKEQQKERKARKQKRTGKTNTSIQKSRKKRRKKLAVVLAPIPKKTQQPLPGKLRLDTVPWTNVYLQGRKIGQTPLIDIKLPAGKIELRFINPKVKIDKTITIEIPAGKRVYKRFDFKN